MCKQASCAISIVHRSLNSTSGSTNETDEEERSVFCFFCFLLHLCVRWLTRLALETTIKSVHQRRVKIEITNVDAVGFHHPVTTVPLKWGCIIKSMSASRNKEGAWRVTVIDV
jgi:hypothetical protein